MGSPSLAHQGSSISPEQAAAILSEYEIILAGDHSGSMTFPVSGTNPKSRWESMQESFLAIAAEVGRIDSNGLDVIFFGGSKGVTPHEGVTFSQIANLFTEQGRPSGGTPLTEALQAALKLAGKSDKKDLIIVFTDGVPDNKATVAQTIINAANAQESDDALTILFIQVGDDAEATRFLQKLDDDLTGAKYDIVDAKTMAQVDAFPSIVDLLIHAING